MSVKDKHARLNIYKKSCYRTPAPKLEKVGLLYLEGPSDYAALLIEVNCADLPWDKIVRLVQSRDMEIRKSADGTMPLSGFGPPAVVDPQPGAATITPQPIPTDSSWVQMLMIERVYQTSAPAQVSTSEPKSLI